MWIELSAACWLALQGSPSKVSGDAERHEPRVADGSALELRAHWEPCRTSTYGLFASTPALRAPAPARERARYDAALFPAIAKEAADPAVRALAARAHAEYLYPVDSQVYSSTGELLDHVCANDLHGDAVARYLELLESPVAEMPGASNGEGESER